MLRHLRLLLLLGLFLISCREHTNQFDIDSDGFTPPPPMSYAFPIGSWYTQDGYLIGLRMQADFVEEFGRTLSIGNVLIQGNSELASAMVSVANGEDSYEVDLLSTSIMSLGDYCVKIYWGEIAIGSLPFSVVEENGRLIIRGVSEYDTLHVTN